MTQQEQTELKINLALAAGFTVKDKGRYEVWSDPSGKVYGSTLPDFLHDLNACFKIIVPVLREKGLTGVFFWYEDDHISCDLHFGAIEYTNPASTESEAFCLAAYKFLSEFDKSR
jgi:hypothetical protein